MIERPICYPIYCEPYAFYYYRLLFGYGSSMGLRKHAHKRDTPTETFDRPRRMYTRFSHDALYECPVRQTVHVQISSDMVRLFMGFRSNFDVRGPVLADSSHRSVALHHVCTFLNPDPCRVSRTSTYNGYKGAAGKT